MPKTVNESRMVENLDLFRLATIDMSQIDGLSKINGAVRFLDPQNHIGFNIFSEDLGEPVDP